jgi:restriction system protein
MRLKMKENSLFAILLRSPWWISFLVAAVIGVTATLMMPLQYRAFAVFSGTPFFIVGCMAAWRQWRAPNAAKATATLAVAAQMPSAAFLAALVDGLRRQGYTVTPYAGRGADFEADKSGRVTLIACKRWKAARHGVEPLRDLQAAAASRGAQDCMYIALGDVSDTARRFAETSKIDIVQGVRLAQLVKIA